MKRIILASSSPRRRVILRSIVGDKFDIVPSSYEEGCRDLPPIELVRHHALMKAREVAKKEEGLVIGVDTVVLLGKEILGKPKDRDDAFAMLKKQNGRKTEVISGIAIVDGTKELVDHEITKVTMKDLSDDELWAYVNSGHGLDKAGAYGLQGKGVLLVERFETCFFNVVGLPINRLFGMLKEFDVDLFDYL